MVGVAVNVTEDPEQIVDPGETVTATEGVTVELVRTILLLFAVEFCKHGVAFEVRITYMESPALGDD